MSPANMRPASLSRRLPLALLLFVACVTPPRPPPERLSPAESIARLERDAARRLPGAAGRLVLARYATTGDRARTLADATVALAADPTDAAALTARLLAALDSLDEPTAAAAALQLLQKAPAHPLAELAAARLRQLSQDRPDTDASIAAALGTLTRDNQGLTGKAAVRAREALAAILDGRNADAEAGLVREALGTVTRFTVYGPLAALRVRGFLEETPDLLAAPSLPASVSGALGTVAPRTFDVPTGLLALDGDPWRADVYEAFADVNVSTPGTHLVSLRGAGMANLWIDGVEVLRRRTMPRRAPERGWGAVELPAGAHRIRLRFSRVDAGFVALALPRADGLPAALDVTFPTSAFNVPSAELRPRPVPPPPGALEWALNPDDVLDPGRLLAHTLLLRLDHDEAARATLADLEAVLGPSPVLRLLRADLLQSHADLPREAVASRVAEEFERLLAMDPTHPRALLGRLEAERADRRWDDVARRLDALRASLGPSHPLPALLAARIALGRDDVEGARRFADDALNALAGWCDALDLRFDLARRGNEVAVADRVAAQLSACPGGLALLAGHHRHRARPDLARPLLERLVARNPSGTSGRQTLADLLVTLGDTAAARTLVEPLVAAWPYQPNALSRLASLAELEGRVRDAASLRARSLAVDDDNVQLARVVALDTGGELLDWARRDGLAAIDTFQKSGFTADAPAIQVLDLGSLEVRADGRQVERVHSIVQVLDKRGIDRHGEVSIPGDAQPLIVRTVKADGTILEAENIAGKDAISLPNLEPGDFVEFEYVRVQAPAPPALGGWAAGPFTFRGEELPFFESTYRVRVHASLGLEIDAANLTPAPVKQDGGWLTFEHSATRVPAFVGEPQSVPMNELLPWLQVGKGPTVEHDLRQRGDWQLQRLRTSPEVDALVADLRGLAPREALHALYHRIRERVPGDGSSSDFSQSTPAILAARRGNRSIVLAAGAQALGFEPRFVLARPFGASRHPFKFPRDQFSLTVLRVRLPDGTDLWFDPSSRHAPFARLSAAYSGLDAWIVPKPDETPEALVLPAIPPANDRTELEYDLVVGAEGGLSGTVVERSHGWGATGRRQGLERTNPEELRKSQERSFARGLRSVEVLSVAPRDGTDPDAPLELVTTLQAPRFADADATQVELPATVQPLRLGPAFLTAGERQSPLQISSDAVLSIRARLQPPAGFTPRLPDPVTLDTPFGRFENRWTAAPDGSLQLDESVVLKRQRIAPAQYAEFRRFIAAIDAAQARDVLLRRPVAPAPPPDAAPKAVDAPPPPPDAIPADRSPRPDHAAPRPTDAPPPDPEAPPTTP